MIKKIINRIWSFDGNENISTPTDINANFVLKYKDLDIGVLSLTKGIWKFAYTDDFKNQKEITPLIEFPEIDKEYTSKVLWPFFSYRIPGLNQPAVKEIIEREHIDANNEVDLLKKFGKITIFNPFLLMPSF
jgi:HipA-like protein